MPYFPGSRPYKPFTATAVNICTLPPFAKLMPPTAFQLDLRWSVIQCCIVIYFIPTRAESDTQRFGRLLGFAYEIIVGNFLLPVCVVCSVCAGVHSRIRHVAITDHERARSYSWQ
jgi:hypothetical protein